MVFFNYFVVLMTMLSYMQINAARGQFRRASISNYQDGNSLEQLEENGRLLETLLNKKPRSDQPLPQLFHIIEYGSPPSYYSQKSDSDSDQYSIEDHYLLPRKPGNGHLYTERELLAKVLDHLHYLKQSGGYLRGSCGGSSGRSCNKAAMKACNRACKRAIKDTCSDYMCKSGMKHKFEKNCKSSCKHEFM